MAPSPTDTIFAVSSGQPPAAATRLAGALPPPRHAALRRLRDREGQTLDRALVLVFPGPDSATGEDLVEFHLHGGQAIVTAVATALAGEGLRPAAAGEFTRRALMHGRIDLAQAEGLADLLAAETETQRRAAVAVAEGAVSRAVGDWSTRLTMLAAAAEAQIDYSDEDDVAADAAAVNRLRDAISELAGQIATVLSQPPVERLRDGIRVVLAGPPNSGKSTLINALAERPVAIATPIAGTTRDRIEAPVTRDGIAYVLTDTAGLTETADPVEAIGVERAREAIAEGDILVWLGDDPGPDGAIRLWARADAAERGPAPADVDCVVAARTGSGIADLWRLLGDRARALLPVESRLAFNRRQREHAGEAAALLHAAATIEDLLLIAEHLRAARVALDRVTGRQATEAMLDALFGRFCIGK